MPQAWQALHGDSVGIPGPQFPQMLNSWKEAPSTSAAGSAVLHYLKSLVVVLYNSLPSVTQKQ